MFFLHSPIDHGWKYLSLRVLCAMLQSRYFHVSVSSGYILIPQKLQVHFIEYSTLWEHEMETVVRAR